VIVLARVDDRLVHGQVTAGWVPHLRAARVVVANDRLAGDPVLSLIVQAGASGVQVEVLPVAEAARRAVCGAWDSSPAIVLFESLQDARRALDAGLAFTCLNLGGLRHEGGSLCICEGITLDPEDCEVLRDLQERGVGIDVRLMPRDRSRVLPEVLR
jgi:mannose/fructose/N-acetylgalactosamine-specific phosphotransferase system component IIB